MGYVEVAMEESARYEGAPTTTPYRISTSRFFLPIDSLALAPGRVDRSRASEQRNIPGVLPPIVDRFEPVGNISIAGFWNYLVPLLNLSGLAPTITAGNGIITDPDGGTIPAGASRVVFNKRLTRPAKTAQLTLGYTEDNVFIRSQGTGVSSIGMDAQGQVSADLMSLVYGRIGDPSLTPSYDTAAILPIVTADMSMTWLSGTGETDDGPSWSIANPLERRKSFSVAARTYFADKMFHGDEWPQLTGTSPKYVFDADDIDALLSGATFAAKLKYVSSKVIGATSYKYSMWVEMPACQYTGGGPASAGNKRRTAASFDWVAAYDETAGYDFKITLICAVTSAQLETLA